MMFTGTFYHTLEEKGRFSLPKDFRARASSWVLTAGLDGCLFVFRSEDFEAEVKKFSALSYLQADHRTLVRHFASHASVQEVDRLGRLSVNEDLRALAGLQKNLVITGALTRIEVWDLKQYHSLFDNLATKVVASSERITL